MLDNLLTGFEENIPYGATFVRADLRDPEGLAPSCAGVDAIFHQAALRSVPRSVDDPVLSESCNITGTLNLLVAAEEAGVSAWCTPRARACTATSPKDASTRR